MKILILGLNFAPELTGVGRYTTDLAGWLSERGHEVRVITAPPYYPEWRVADGYAAAAWRRESIGPVQVLRCPIWLPRTVTPLTRILHLLSFAATSFVPCLWQAARFRPDLIWAVEPTALAAPAALLAARLCGARACLHVQDLEAEAVCGLGLIRSRYLRKLLQRAYGALVRRFDLVSTICVRMQARLRQFGVAEERLCLFPNWVDTDAIRPLPGPSVLRRQWGCADTQVLALYGAGAARPRLERRLAGCANVILLPLQPEGRLNALLNAADIHLLPQRAEAETFALPSKLAGILASGRPLIAQAAGGELAAATRRCGILVAPGDAEAMAAAIIELASDPKRRRRLGQMARQLAEDHLERAAIIARYEQRLSWLVSSRAAGSRIARPGAVHRAPKVPHFAGRAPAQLGRG